MGAVYRKTATNPLPSGEDCQRLDIADRLAKYKTGATPRS